MCEQEATGSAVARHAKPLDLEAATLALPTAPSLTHLDSVWVAHNVLSDPLTQLRVKQPHLQAQAQGHCGTHAYNSLSG
jgi:hypothetical protein